MIWLDWVIAATRFISFIASILLAATVGFYLLTKSSGNRLPTSELFSARLILSLEVVALLAQAAWSCGLLWSLCAEMEGDPLDECKSLLFETQFGRIGLWRCALLFALILYRGLWVFAQRKRFGTRESASPAKPGWIETLLTFGQLGLLTWFSHAAAGVGPWGWIQLANDLLHLVGAAFWPGGLVPLWLLLKRPAPEALKREALLKFSNVAVVAAPLMGATGVLSAYFRMHDLTPLFTTIYGRYVLLKVGCFFILVALGAANRFRLVPALVNRSVGNPRRREDWGKLRRNVLIEQVLFVVILFAVARLGTLAPPH